MRTKENSPVAKSKILRFDVIVTAIVACLMLGLVTLTVQASVGYSRRVRCGNNIKWFTLGLQNYADMHGMFPPGARSRTTPPPTRDEEEVVTWGPSWLVALLPHYDQRDLYARLREVDFAAVENDYVSQPMLQAAAGRRLKLLVCPSSPLPPTQTLQGVVVDVPSYVGIAGARTNPGSCSPGPYGGCVSSNGTLGIVAFTLERNERYALEERVKWNQPYRSTGRNVFAQAHRLAIGEVAHWYYDNAGNKRNLALSFAGNKPKESRSWLAGTNLRKRWDIYDPPAPNRVLNVVMIEHPINTNNRWGGGDDDPNWGTQGIGLCGLNNPLGSGHTGGIMGGYVDGHVAFVSAGIDLTLLKQQATN